MTFSCSATPLKFSPICLSPSLPCVQFVDTPSHSTLPRAVQGLLLSLIPYLPTYLLKLP